MRRGLLLLVLIATVTLLARTTRADERLPLDIQRDVLESLGPSSSSSLRLSSEADDSSNSFLAPPLDTDEIQHDRSLLNQAESITSEVESEMEDAMYQDIPGLKDTIAVEEYTDSNEQTVSPSLLLETSQQEDNANSLPSDILHELSLESAVDRAHQKAEEMEIGLLEEHTQVSGKPKGEFITPAYAEEAAPPAPVAAKPVQKQSVQYTTPEYAAEPTAVAPPAAASQQPAAQQQQSAAARQRQALQASMSHHSSAVPSPVASNQATSTDAQPPSDWIVAGTIPRGSSSPSSASKGGEHAGPLAAPPSTSAPTSTTASSPSKKPQPKKYISPSYYPSAPSPAHAYPPPAHSERVLVQTPQGPVWVEYVTKPRPHSGAHESRQIVRSSDGGTYILPEHPTQLGDALPPPPRRHRRRRRGPSIAERRRTRLRELQTRQATQQLISEQSVRDAQYDPQTNTLVRHVHHHHFTRAPPPPVFVLPPAEESVAVPSGEPSLSTLQRAYKKLCDLQSAILTKYNQVAKSNARSSASELAEKYGTSSPRSVVLSRASDISARYATDHATTQEEAEAIVLRTTYQRHLQQYQRAQRLIERAERWLSAREELRRLRHAKWVCRKRARAEGRPVPRRCECSKNRKQRRTRHRRSSHPRHHGRVPRRSDAWHSVHGTREAEESRQEEIYAAAARCRELARAAGVFPIPEECEPQPMSQAVFKKNRYDEETNKIRFAQVGSEADAEAEAEAETQTESETQAESEVEAGSETEAEAATETEVETEGEAEAESETESTTDSESSSESESSTEAEAASSSDSKKLPAFAPVDGLDFNQSPLIKELLAQLHEHKLEV